MPDYRRSIFLEDAKASWLEKWTRRASGPDQVDGSDEVRSKPSQSLAVSSPRALAQPPNDAGCSKARHWAPHPKALNCFSCIAPGTLLYGQHRLIEVLSATTVKRMDNPWADDPWNESAKKTPEEHHEPPVQQKWDISSTPAIAISNDSKTTPVSPSWEPKESLSWTPAVDDAVSVPSWHAEDDSWTSPDISLPEPDTFAAIATSSSPPDERHESDEHDSPTPALVASNQENFQPFDSRDTNAIPQITASPIFNQAQDSDGDDFGGDGFGGFETGLDSSTEPNAAWLPSPETFAGTDANGEDAWGSSWEGADTSVRESDEEPLDEWESARQQKAQQDRHVVSPTPHII